jgi:cytochrome c
MGELGFNKIFGAILVVFLAVMGLREVAYIVFGGGGHYGSVEYESQNAWAEKNFAYRTDIAEIGGGGTIIEEIYDLGLLLAGADLQRGQRSFEAKCASCHSIEQGGANGTGPNLWNTIGGEKQHIPAFNYSGALNNTEGDWSWENMDAWLENPSRYARGTSMGFAGLKRDDERANVLMYMAQYSPKAPPVPEPLPAVEPELESVDGDILDNNPSLATGEIVMQDAALGDNTEMVTQDTAEAIAETTLEGEGNDGVEVVTDPNNE